MNNIEFRSQILKSYGAESSYLEELLNYNKNIFDHSNLDSNLKFPLSDELHVSTWENYAIEAKKIGLFDLLKKRMIQFQFPIQAGISQTESYRSTTRRGFLQNGKQKQDGLLLNQPEKLQLVIHQSLAGRIPVIIANDREDFVTLVRAFTMRNEPNPVPQAMGACMVTGFNNWDRIFELRKKWESENPQNRSEKQWQAEFRRIISQKENYQDRFIILSNGPYSAIPANEMDLSMEDWQKKSLTIRLEHECTHYFTRRVLSSMQNNLLDELLADYMGIVAAEGHFRADWFLRFMGLENFPHYRSGGRLENYRGVPPLSDDAFNILLMLVKDAAGNLELCSRKIFDKQDNFQTKFEVLIALTHLTLEEFASPQVETIIKKVK